MKNKNAYVEQIESLALIHGDQTMTGDSGIGLEVIRIGGYMFEGPFETPLELQDRPGVFIILDVRGSACRIVDIGESAAVKSRVMEYDRKICWMRQAKGILKVAVHYADSAQFPWRKQLMEELRMQFVPPCRVES